MTPHRLRVASYNIHKGVSTFGRRSRLAELRLALHELDADIVLLQEVQERNDRPGRRDPAARSGQLDALAGSAYAHRAYGANAYYPHGNHGNAILSRLPIERLANHDISDHPLERRGMLHALARRGGGGAGVHLLCVHFGLVKASRVRQAQWVADFIEREIAPGAPLVLAGDLNDWQRRVDRIWRERLGMVEAFDAAHPLGWRDRVFSWARTPRGARTFPSFAPWLALDRIYVRHLRVRAASVPRGAAWARCSDHVPIVADLEWP